jgi:hypothetical protein
VQRKSSQRADTVGIAADRPAAAIFLIVGCASGLVFVGALNETAMAHEKCDLIRGQGLLGEGQQRLAVVGSDSVRLAVAIFLSGFAGAVVSYLSVR